MDTEQETASLISPYGTDLDGQAFGPNPTQQKILDWVDAVRERKTSTSIPVLLLQGGVGSGKSRGLMAPAIEMLCEIPGLRMFWGRQDLKDLKLSIMDKFFEVLPPELMVGKSEQYQWYDIRTKGKGKSRIFFNGLKDLSGLGSQEFGVIIVTEAHEITENAYRTLKRRCRQSGVPNMILIESEPPNEGHWITRLTDPLSEEYDKDIEKWELSTYENWNNLPESYRGSLEGMPDAWKRKYLFGKAGFIPSGRPFYEGFKEPIHVGEYQYNTAKPLILGWDFGFVHPAVSFHQFDDNGRWFILREIMGSNITIQHFAPHVKEFLNINFPNANIKCFGDPACMQVNDKSEKTSWHICKEHGFDIGIKQSDYRTRKEIIDQKLSNLLNGKPMLCVDRRCKIIIDGFLGGYHYPEQKQGQEFTQKFEIPFHDEFYSHLLNTVEYVAVNTFRPIQRHTNTAHKIKKQQPANAGFGFSK
jgi:hypothetical protein